jgi:DNA modification methylase
VDRLIGMYTKEGDKVLDPFMGCGSSVIGAIQNNRFCYGFEIKKKVFNMAQQNIVSSLNLLVNADYEIYNDNALEGLDYIDSNDVQLVISAPSLPSLKEVEEEQVEFDKMNKEQYLTNMEIIFKKLYRIVKKGGYCTFVVDDYRDIKHKEPYVELHSEIAQIGKKVGFLYQDCIIYDHNDQRGLLLLGYPRIFYANMNHTYIVVLRKE